MSTNRRNRASTAASSPISSSQSLDALTKHLQQLSVDAQVTGDSPDVDTLLIRAQQLRSCIEAAPASARINDAFRHLHGFSTLLDTIRATSGYYHSEKRNEHEKESVIKLVGEVLSVLAEVFRDHYGNKKYFKNRVEGGGWYALEQAIASIGFGGSDSDSWTENKLFGMLLGFAVDDERLRPIFEVLHHQYTNSKQESALQDDGGVSDDAIPTNLPDDASSDSGQNRITKADREFLILVQERLSNLLTDNTLLSNAEIVPSIVAFWRALPRDRPVTEASTAILVIEFFHRVSTVSHSNLLALHSQRILSPLLPLAFETDSPLPLLEKQSVAALCHIMMPMGLSELDDARYLIRSKSDDAAEFLLRMSKVSHHPSHIQFDLSLNGYSCLELNLGRSFPPLATQGYTFTAWIYIDQFDPDTHTTIFGLLDQSQTCFVLAYLEKDTHNLILQTSVTSTRPSVRFKSTVFKEHRWYHIAVSHRRPKTLSVSKASLHVNGDFVEQVKIQYPSAPPATSNRISSVDSFPGFNSTAVKTSPVQAFVGTPFDLATRLGQGVVHSKWSLATAHLFEDVLSDDFLLCHAKLGPRYNGNFQDCLGAFQTYEASAALSLRNEAMHVGKDQTSDIMTAVKNKASTILSESHVLLSILPTSVLSDDVQETYHASQIIRGLKKAASHNLYSLGKQSAGLVVLNAAIPCINDGLVRPNGTCTMAGDPVIVVPQTMDDAMWRLGGCTAIVLKVVESATTREATVRAVELLFESIKGNWRNSDAMEREGGYPVLSWLLRNKLSGQSALVTTKTASSNLTPLDADERSKLSFELLSLVLGFVGYDHAKPENSTILNPLAYRILLLDNDIWRRSALITQKLYYKQFTTFSIMSKSHHFNTRRLNRMRPVKRFLEALKGNLFPVETFPDVLDALFTLVKSNLNTETYRGLSLFVTYALNKSTATSSGNVSSRTSIMSTTSRRPTMIASIDTKSLSGDFVSKRDMAIGVLERYTELLCDIGTSVLKKFASYVTIKWLLFLVGEDDPQIVVLGTKILARLLVVHGSTYVAKFAERNDGFAILTHKLNRWWNEPALWTICFCILFDYDVVKVDFEKDFEMFSLLEIFQNSKVVNPQILPTITAMLSTGLKSLLQSQNDPDSPVQATVFSSNALKPPVTPGRSRSMSLNKDLENRNCDQPKQDRLSGQATVLHAVLRFLTDLHSKSQNFKDFAIQSEYVRQLLFLLYPAIVNTDVVSPSIELNSRDSSLPSEVDDVALQPTANSVVETSPVAGYSSLPVETQLHRTSAHPRLQLRRGSSFILLSRPVVEASKVSSCKPSKAKLVTMMPPSKNDTTQQFSHAIVEEILELVINVFIDQIIERKDFAGLGLFLKVPPGIQEHQTTFESYVLRNTIAHISATIKFDQKLLWETRVIQNMAKFCHFLGEAVYEGWFLDGAEPIIDFAGDILDYLQHPDVAKIKAVRWCSHAVNSIRTTFSRVVLWRLSELDNPDVAEEAAVAFMKKLHYWQTVVLAADNNEEDKSLRLICYQLYTKLVDPHKSIQEAAIDLWRIILVQKPEATSTILALANDRKHLASGFKRLMELDNETFIDWVASHRAEIDALFFGTLSRTWDEFVATENSKTESTSRVRIARRRERLKAWLMEELNHDAITSQHESRSATWKRNIYESEHLKHLRTLQDEQDALSFTIATFGKMDNSLRRPCAVFDDASTEKWQLDRSEGRNRMRLRMLPDHSMVKPDYRPKRRTETDSVAIPPIDVKLRSSRRSSGLVSSPIVERRRDRSLLDGANDGESLKDDKGEVTSQSNSQEDFELVDDPSEAQNDGYEDKNRKVMRSLKSGDQVQDVFNISRIVGLESCEGLLIVGKHYLYLIDNVFQRSDGEIVSVAQAPADERDPYLQMISGQKASHGSDLTQIHEQVSRSWKWHDILIMSKRRFLLRDVAIEIFFTDGRSYLLTASSKMVRDDLYGKMTTKAPHSVGAAQLPNPEESWRLEAIRVAEDAPAGFGSKFGNIFNSSAWNPAMRRWVKGEISNFHYLMLVNTMAGRTFNDLTQYPVFPWVIADYTSEELDLDNPATFRDLTKPMGCQHASRQADFVDRYKSFAEMGDQPPFHYGTHYSSAMIVTSYLIRLQPFVQSYLLLQGGSFDHPDRLFYSIEKAWNSASKNNMTDVRELIPEFFYLPEFLSNHNGFNFGMRQGTGGSIDNVALPPWAKGDPKIFIAKQREALESPYASRHLHEWIDLIFGSKQRGEAALDNVNVFHHLSYSGATDLDRIVDPVERLAAIGIIHNFGQTPLQIFSKSHQARDDIPSKPKYLDKAAETLRRLPFPLLETREAVASLIYSSKHARPLSTTAFRLHIPPLFDKCMEWGFADNSVRFYHIENRKLISLQENLHQGQLSCAAFADSRTLITAGVDCVVSVWSLDLSQKSIDLVPKTSLFGHKQPVSALVISKSFSTIISASLDGQVLLWDLNRLEFVRKLANFGRYVECLRINNITGDIMVCRGQKLALYTLNGDCILDQVICTDHDDYIFSCAFYEGIGNEWLENDLIFTGHKRGIVNIWKKAVNMDGKWFLQLVKKLEGGDQKTAEGAMSSSTGGGGPGGSAAICALLPMPSRLFTGDEEGKVYEWDVVRHER